MIIFLAIQFKHVFLGAQKHLIETILLSTHNNGKKIILSITHSYLEA